MIKYNRTERGKEKKEKREDDEVPIRSSSTALKTVGKHRASGREGSGCHRLPPDSTGNVRQVLDIYRSIINFFFFLNFTCPLLCTSSIIYFVKKSTEEEEAESSELFASPTYVPERSKREC